MFNFKEVELTKDNCGVISKASVSIYSVDRFICTIEAIKDNYGIPKTTNRWVGYINSKNGELKENIYNSSRGNPTDLYFDDYDEVIRKGLEILADIFKNTSISIHIPSDIKYEEKILEPELINSCVKDILEINDLKNNLIKKLFSDKLNIVSTVESLYGLINSLPGLVIEAEYTFGGNNLDNSSLSRKTDNDYVTKLLIHKLLEQENVVRINIVYNRKNILCLKKLNNQHVVQFTPNLIWK